MLSRLREKHFEIQFESHAKAILQTDFPDALAELEQTLLRVEIPITEIIGSGGGETKGTQRMRRAMAEFGWRKINFEIKKIVNGHERQSISHEIDHVKAFPNGVLALEIEWNNKDPFFDRDLENFKRLHAESAISAGIIVTRAVSLHGSLKELVLRFAREQGIQSFADLEKHRIAPTTRQRSAIQQRAGRARNPIEFPVAWADQFVADKYGEATTHWRKLADRVTRGVGNPCPLLLIGLPSTIVTFPETGTPEQIAADIEAADIEATADLEGVYGLRTIS